MMSFTGDESGVAPIAGEVLRHVANRLVNGEITGAYRALGVNSRAAAVLRLR